MVSCADGSADAVTLPAVSTQPIATADAARVDAVRTAGLLD
jgi:hypothetical protein